MKVYDLKTTDNELVRGGLMCTATGDREMNVTLFACFIDGPIALNANVKVNIFEDVDELLTADRIGVLMNEQKVKVTHRKFTESSPHSRWTCSSPKARRAIVDCMLTGSEHVRTAIQRSRSIAADRMLNLD